jgi:hypothetical protein
MARGIVDVSKPLKTAKKVKPHKQAALNAKITMIYDGVFICPICEKTTSGLKDQGQHLTCLDTIGGKKKWKAALLAGASKTDKASTNDMEMMKT